MMTSILSREQKQQAVLTGRMSPDILSAEELLDLEQKVKEDIFALQIELQLERSDVQVFELEKYSVN